MTETLWRHVDARHVDSGHVDPARGGGHLDEPPNSELGTLPAKDVDRVEATLLARFSPPLRPETVQRCLVDCIALFELSTVRNYLAILIERTATDRLRAEIALAGEADRGDCLLTAGESEIVREHLDTGRK